MSIKVKYIYSACVIIETEDCRILCDPWFTDAIYDGSWFHFPKVKDPINLIGDVDLIYISHIHPDHYDPSFLKEYMSYYGNKNLIIPDHKPNYLYFKMKGDGFKPEIIEDYKSIKIDKTTIDIIPHKTKSINDIDSALAVQYNASTRKHVVVNVNDIIADRFLLTRINKDYPSIDILLCAYTGAGPYPQTYYDLENKILREKGKQKKEEFFERYRYLTSSLNSKVNIPFAGKYILGGKLSKLNDYRGVADAVEVLEFDKKAVVLGDAGSSMNTEDLRPTSVRTKKYSKQKFKNRLKEIENEKMDYERLMDINEIYQLPLKRLIAKSYENAISKSECDTNYFFIFTVFDDICIMNANKNNKSIVFKKVGELQNIPENSSEIIIDPRYLFGLITNIYHWNNAEIGSQFRVKRYPDNFNRNAQNFLNFLSI